jgi:hypothetical protein
MLGSQKETANGPRYELAAHQPDTSVTWHAFYTADKFLASNDIIAMVRRCKSKSAHFQPLQPQFM